MPYDPVSIDAIPRTSRSFESLGAPASIASRLGDRPPVAVGPGRPFTTPAMPLARPDLDVSGFPVQVARVQRPALRDSTLRRDRLLDWLHTKIHHRVVFVTAEAGYGKTTLLADFARRTRLRTLWYRLDEEDGDWISFLNYLVAAGRQVEPGFAPATGAMLAEIGTSGPARDAIVDSFVRELGVFGAAGAVLVIDDYHLVDDAPDLRSLLRELVTRGPERLTFVFSSRRRPTIPLARLRALGELVELHASDLRFDEAETEQLFREAYRTPLEPDVLADLNRRTEGWAASLQLVQAAIRDRSMSEIRAFVRGLSGAHAELHDYLAEEVIGDLAPDLRAFLMATSILQSVEPNLAAVAAGIGEDEALVFADQAEALGLLPSQGDRRGVGSRYHPLVRDFLEARLRREVGPQRIVELHRRVAEHAESRSWRLAAHHRLAAGDLGDVSRIVSSSTRAILGCGEFALAETYVDRFALDASDPAFDVIRSRMELHRDQVPLALQRARAAFAAFPDDSTDPNANIALANLMSVESNAGDLDIALALAQTLFVREAEPSLSAIAAATIELLRGSTDGRLDTCKELLAGMLEAQEAGGDLHYAGITHLNLANVAKARGDAAAAAFHADRAIDALARSSASHEMPAGHLLKAWALAHMGRWEESLAAVQSTMAKPHLARSDSLQEAADLHGWYGSVEVSEELLAEARCGNVVLGNLWRVSHAQNLVRLNRLQEAELVLAETSIDTLTRVLGHKSRHLFVLALISTMSGSSDSAVRAADAVAHAQRQGASFWERTSQVLGAYLGPPDEWSSAVLTLLEKDPAAVNLLAEAISSRLDDLGSDCLPSLVAQVRLRPERWRSPLRSAISASRPSARLVAAELLNEVGTDSDIPLLRRVAKELRAYPTSRYLGTGLARRLAPRVYVEDQGRVSVRVGDRVLPETSIRRKVLALLCYLLTRADLSATRDQVLEALWPDLEPDVGANSLNQTVYFLRRVFEPAYREEVSPGYVHHDSDVVWLESALVSSRSRSCREMISRAGEDLSPENVQAVCDVYSGRFALDFSYEEWASAYRDSLHAAFLEIVEAAIRLDTNSGEFRRAIAIARRAVDVDPEAEHLELSLLRLYRLTGAHAAAAEQYGHYAAVLRDELGVDPPPLDTV